MLKCIGLKRVEEEGKPSLYYADGKKISQDRYNAIVDEAVRLESMSTQRKGNAWHHYSTARVR